ncbi:ABC transporter permease subunit [Nocardioides sp. 1609]|uniref:ABC transporter permease n=1 Tax=Nocardioides sp. 1609 TaxID=2508327 RepID=UPI00106FAF4D|nr:ABC transporter permease subunit [Nocardioides sp. 1609]
MTWTRDNLPLIWELTLAHVQLAILPIVLSFVLSIPLGWLANRNRVLRTVVITAGSLLYTIPSLPLFVILPPLIGTQVLDSTNLVVALSIYGVAIMARSAADALASVDRTVLDASSAVGYGAAARFFRVELPLSGPVLLAGIRVVSVSTIALTSVGVIIGSRNLGYLFNNGKQRDILEEVAVGIVMSLLIALVLDVVIVTLGRILMPWNRPDRAGSRSRTVALVEPGGPGAAGTPSAAADQDPVAVTSGGDG